MSSTPVSERRESERPLPPMSAPVPKMGFASSPAPPPLRPQYQTIPPPTMDELEERYAQRPNGVFAPEQAIDEQIADLEGWALANVRSERMEITRFWLLRGLAFVGTVAAAGGGALLVPQLAIGFGAVAALAIVIDAAWPTTADRSARRRAIHDLRELQQTLKLRWDKVKLAYPDPKAIKRIAHALALLDAIQTKREEIGKYLGDPTPGVQTRVGA